jgi:hypothetical protein
MGVALVAAPAPPAQWSYRAGDAGARAEGGRELAAEGVTQERVLRPAWGYKWRPAQVQA